MIKTRWIKTEGHRFDSYVDIHQAFRIVIVEHNNLFKVRAHFLVTTDLFPNRQEKVQSAYYEDIAMFEKEKQAVIFVEKLLKPFLTGVEDGKP